MYSISEIYSTINAAFPFCEAEKWDNAGLLVDPEIKVTKIIVALDASVPVVNEAISKGAQLIVTHHPVIFNPIKSLSLRDPAVLALKNSVAIISAHTNYDVGYLSADAHLSKLLADAVDFREDDILDITHTEPIPHGFGRIGRLGKPMSSDEFALKLKEALGSDAIRYTPIERQIRKIAFCCGGGSSYFEKVASQGFDAYITSDVKHNHFTDAINTNTALFVPTHYQMEKPSMSALVSLLKQSFPEAEVILSESEKEPSKVI